MTTRGILAVALAAGMASPPVGAQEAAARAAFLGDTGTGGSSQRAVAERLGRLAPPLVFMLGDNVYEWGDRRKFPSVYDGIYSQVMARGASFHAALGNHDVKYCDAVNEDPLPDNRNAYAWRRLRCDVEDHLDHASFGYYQAKRYYSIRSDAGAAPLMEVFVLDSNTLNNSQSKLPLWREDTAQVRWLDAVLGASRAVWKVVVMHHPPHSPTTGARFFFLVPLGEGRAREYKLDQQLSPILRRHRVDAVITGHNHFYARMVPQDGIRYFVAGGGGRGVYPFVEAPGYVAAGGDFYHFLYVRATASAFYYYAIDRDGRSRDAGWFTKGDQADRALPRGTLPPS